MPDLRVIDGGSGGVVLFREHPLASSLWKVTSQKPHPTRRDEIAARIRAEEGRPIAVSMVDSALYHVRHHSEEYGWTVPHVQRGYGAGHAYYPVRIESNITKLTEAMSESLRDGAYSTAATIGTMGEHCAAALEAAADAKDVSPRQRRERRAAASMLTAAVEMAKRALASLAA